MTTQTNSTNNKKGAEFFKGVKSELKKVAWPNKKDMVSYTSVVLAACVIAAVFIGIVDGAFHEVLKLIIK